jgi:recombination protein RecR
MGGPEIQTLIALLSKVPGMGPRSARRAALTLLSEPETRLLPLAAAMAEAARVVRACARCGNLDTSDPCAICADPNRDGAIICVVEGVGDLWALDRGGLYLGHYHVLGGTLSPRAGAEGLNIDLLLRRVALGGVNEVILAMSATVDGANTAHYLSDRLRPTGVSVTRVGQGVPMGGALDVLDDGTLAAALRTRRGV